MGDDRGGFHGRIDTGGITGPVWVIGWLFTMGYLHLGLTKAVFAIVIWPYYLGGSFHK